MLNLNQPYSQSNYGAEKYYLVLAVIGGILLGVYLFIVFYVPARDVEEPYSDEWFIELVQEELEEEK